MDTVRAVVTTNKPDNAIFSLDTLLEEIRELKLKVEALEERLAEVEATV